MFLPFRRNNAIGTNEMLPLLVESIPYIDVVFETYSTVLASILMVAPSNTIEKNMCRLSKDECRTSLKELSISSTAIHKNPQSLQLVKINHVGNG